MTPSPLHGTVALVTGASRGIGRAVAEALADDGAAVGLLGRDRDRLDEVGRAISDLGGTAAVAVADVTDAGAVERAVSHVTAALGPVDLLVNNAGVRERAAALPWEQDPEDWWHTVTVNVRGPFLVASAVLPGMVARGIGRVLNVGSGYGLRPDVGYSGYAVSKAALSRLSNSLALATAGTGVVVLEASPGVVRTDMTETMWETPPASGFGDAQPMVALVRAFAAGRLDALDGRFVHAQKDELDELVARAEEIRAGDARVLRLRPYGADDPLR